MNIVNQENEQKYGEDFPQPIVRNGKLSTKCRSKVQLWCEIRIIARKQNEKK